MTSPEPTDLSSYRERRVLEESGAEALPRRGSSFENSVMRAFIEYTAERTSEKLRSDMAQVVAEQLEKVGEARSHALHFSPFLTFDQADPRRFEYPPREGDVVVFDDTEEKVYVHQGPETRAVIRPEPGRTPPPRASGLSRPTLGAWRIIRRTVWLLLGVMVASTFAALGEIDAGLAGFFVGFSLFSLGDYLASRRNGATVILPPRIARGGIIGFLGLAIVVVVAAY